MAHPPLDIDFTYDLAALFDPQVAHGIISLDFADLDGGGQNDTPGNGLRGQINLHIANDLGVPLGTPASSPLFVFLGDFQSDAEVNTSGHPLYAHFHGVGSTYGGLSAEAGTFSGSGTSGAPGTITLTGVVGAGTTATIGPVVMHERDQAGVDDSFALAFFRTDGAISPTDFADLQAQWDALHPLASPVGGGGGSAVDWNALGERVLVYFGNTGQWGDLDDWLTPPPPDGGPADYLLA